MPTLRNRFENLRVWGVASLMLLAPCCLTARAETLHVPGEYATIQAAIDAAVDGDEILVADGVYTGEGNKNLDFGGKAIAVRSENGAESCIIDCEGLDRGFHFHSGETSASLVEGLTIRNGYVDYDSAGQNFGGAMLCQSGSNPTISRCIIADNVALRAPSGAGGGIACEASSPTISNCLITGNLGACLGGGVSCEDHSNPIISHCTIEANQAGSGGSAIRCSWDCSPSIINCIITANAVSAEAYGGAIYCFDSSPTITNCLIAENTTPVKGAALFLWHESDPTITNCTVTRNVADSEGGAIYCEQDSSPTITNSVLWANTPDEISVSDDSSAVITYCAVQGGWPGQGNIDVDPGLAFTYDAHLASGSPCIDAGTDSPPGGLPVDDVDGNPRPLDGDGDLVATADMGAFEFNPDVPSIARSPSALEFFIPEGDPDSAELTVSIRNSGGGTLNWEITEQCSWLQVDPPSGTSSGETDDVLVTADVQGLSHGDYDCQLTISDPQAINSPRTVAVTLHVNTTLRVPAVYATIQSAIDAAVAGDVVLVADGVYTGEGNKNLDFQGKPITLRSENGPADCIIDCESDGRGIDFHSGESNASIVDGFTITNGHGRAISCTNRSSPTIRDCVIAGNSSGGYGGGILSSNSSPIIVNCLIIGNTAEKGGGGVNAFGSRHPTLANCTIAANNGGWSGGAINMQGGTIVNCTIARNTADKGGGVDTSGNTTIVNCRITGNVASGSGGGVLCSGGPLTITNCTITANQAGGSGGGIDCRASEDQTIVNCIIWGNVPHDLDSSCNDATITYSNVRLGWPGEGNIDADPLFVDPDGPDDDPNTWEDNDFRLSTGSPCTDAGNNTAVPADLLDLDGDGDTAERTPLDLDDHARFADDPLMEDTGVPDPPDYPNVVDMGAYEFGFGDLDRDGVVGGSDLLTLLENYGAASGMTYADGDLDGDGDIDLSDLAWLLGVFGRP